MKLSKICTLILAGVGAIALATDVHAQALSDSCRAQLSEQPISIAVPNQAGGGYDIYARAIAPELAAVTGARVGVVNMPGGGGRLALLHVATQDDREIRLILESFTDLIAGTDGDASVPIPGSDFTPLGIIFSEPAAWLGRTDIDLADPDLDTLDASASSILSNLADIGLVGRALGLNFRMIAGYDGSSETAAAILRGEADLTSQSLTTTIGRSAGTELGTILVLRDTPDARAPDALLLGGPDGLLEQRIAGLPAEEQELRRAAARAAMTLTTATRGLLTASGLDAETLDCLRAATDLALASPGFAATAESQGRLVEARPSHEAVEVYGTVRQAFLDQADVLLDIADELSR